MNPSTDPKNHILVHKLGDEGTITIDNLTGGIVTPIDERPDWAEGLANALPRERETFYKTRLGEDIAATNKPDAIAFEDLAWVGVDGEGDLVELSADHEFRMEVVKEFLGIDEETGEMTKDGWRTVAEVEIALDNVRTSEEASAITEELSKGFSGSSTDVNHDEKKTNVSSS